MSKVLGHSPVQMSTTMKRKGEDSKNETKKLKQEMTKDRKQVLETRLKTLLQGDCKELIRNPTSIDVLFTLTCCGRCMLRFLGVRDYEIYALSSIEIKDILNQARTEPTPTLTAETETGEPVLEPICAACVGIVQYAEDHVDLLVERIRTEGFVSKTFNMNVTLPATTLLRNHCIAIYLRQRLASRPIDQVDIKEAFKLLISWPLEVQTDMALDFSSELKMQVSIKHDETKGTHLFLTKIKESGLVIKSRRENRKTVVVGDGRANIVKALENVSDEVFIDGGHVPPTAVMTRPQLESIEMTRTSIYVGGRYLKYSRDVSQTPWAIGTTVLAELSVSGIVCDTLKKAFRADDFKFVTAGREDANVRMLGNGRPFYMELINPRIPSLPRDKIKELETEINAIMPGKVQIRSLAAIRPEDTKIIKEGEESKTKSYSALCWTSSPVDQTMIDAVNMYTDKAFFVEQQTPIRVLQRRAQMIRKKQIHSLKAFPVEGHFMAVHLHTEAGTYIKEFVHGDLGRNQPSLGSIVGCEADIMELDVLEVDLEFPPPDCLK
ncbi:putative tRNA pseudouridine synthase Pus10 [Mortierella polycephala]|uniref:tRNA pseudouridine(55) synthase n=1 Tax=Mortierella polycephala TaxID=41804 RepID=A0A9P6U672_9FUNG|nr:putative tRNA pseudouridine synthase Pus10 [Mortierella polycephala]